jgi:hypothetical protein
MIMQNEAVMACFNIYCKYQWMHEHLQSESPDLQVHMCALPFFQWDSTNQVIVDTQFSVLQVVHRYNRTPVYEISQYKKIPYNMQMFIANFKGWVPQIK